MKLAIALTVMIAAAFGQNAPANNNTGNKAAVPAPATTAAPAKVVKHKKAVKDVKPAATATVAAHEGSTAPAAPAKK